MFAMAWSTQHFLTNLWKSKLMYRYCCWHFRAFFFILLVVTPCQGFLILQCNSVDDSNIFLSSRSVLLTTLLLPSSLFYTRTTPKSKQQLLMLHSSKNNDNNKSNNIAGETIAENQKFSFASSDSASRGIVSLLTDIVNNVVSPIQQSITTNNSTASTLQSSSAFIKSKAYFENDASTIDDVTSIPSLSTTTILASPPQTPIELMERIKRDYTTKNYLWTGDIDLPCFDIDCQFTDPTISFKGCDKFVSNLQNLRPLIDALTTTRDKNNSNQSAGTNCQSVLLDISLNSEQNYVQTRWNMVGSLVALPWQPKIDVIGRTKFWFKPNVPTTTVSKGTDSKIMINDKGGSKVDSNSNNENTGWQVYYYDEEWEIPAWKALLQLVTPGSRT